MYGAATRNVLVFGAGCIFNYINTKRKSLIENDNFCVDKEALLLLKKLLNAYMEKLEYYNFNINV